MRIEGFTKRGFHYVAEFMPGLMQGKITLLGHRCRCWYAEVMDVESSQRFPVIKIFWSDLNEHIRDVYFLDPGQSLLITLSPEKSALFRSPQPDDVLEFVRVA